MLLRDVHTDPISARRYMERYINGGSPSGFTQRYTSSPETNPFGVTPQFCLWSASIAPDCIEDMGRLPGWLRVGEIPLHPDMVDEPIFTVHAANIHRTDVMVTPTASTRTVEILDSRYGGYIKLNYDRLLGRVNRRLTRSHANAALDVTRILEDAVAEGTLPPLFAFFAEFGARVALLQQPDETSLEWGAVFRELNPHPWRETTAFLIPAFSLFALDSNRPADPPLLAQLIELAAMPSDEYIYENIARPIVSCYFELLLRYALQFECNAQNMVLGFDLSGSITTVAFRDFESVDKDISLAEDLELTVIFNSYPFKCVKREFYNYSIKHSFMYDFKLGEYVLTPIIGMVEPAAQAALSANIRELARDYIRRLPVGFFPLDGLWYSYANVVVDKTSKRPYVGLPNPRYR
jgi:hypothetical protein